MSLVSPKNERETITIVATSTVVVTILGLLIGWLARPSLPVMGKISFSEYIELSGRYTEGTTESLVICGIIAAVVGAAIGFYLAHQNAKTSRSLD